MVYKLQKPLKKYKRQSFFSIFLLYHLTAKDFDLLALYKLAFLLTVAFALEHLRGSGSATKEKRRKITSKLPIDKLESTLQYCIFFFFYTNLLTYHQSVTQFWAHQDFITKILCSLGPRVFLKSWNQRY